MNTRLLSILVSAASLSMPAMAQDVGARRFLVQAEHRDQAVEAIVWYPFTGVGQADRLGDNAIFFGRDAVIDAPLPDTSLPTVILSHGSGGNMLGLAWLAQGLAAQGALVVGLNHPGSTSGDSVPSRSVHLDLRALDASAVLDHVLADPALAAVVDAERIAALGFSMGGGTVMQLAGARFSAQGFRDFCATYDRLATGCAWMQSDGFDLNDWPASAERDLRDARISRAMVVDPAFGFAWAPGSVESIDIPMALINLGDTSLTSDWMGVGAGPDSSGLVGRIRDASYHVIPDAMHFSFLPECRFYAPLLVWLEGEDPVCSDPWGSDRGAVHAEIVDRAARFMGLGPGVE